MLAVPPELARRYEARLVQQNVMAGQRPHDHQWLRYYLDFCHRYSLAPTAHQSLPAFQEKLRAKQQPESLCQQAGEAMSLYWEMVSPSTAKPHPWRWPSRHKMSRLEMLPMKPWSAHRHIPMETLHMRAHTQAT